MREKKEENLKIAEKLKKESQNENRKIKETAKNIGKEPT